MHLKFLRPLAVLLSAVLFWGNLKADTPFNFTLAREGKTSAGVYDASGKLVSTLWSDAYYGVGGAYGAVWNNKDDSGATVPAGTYTIKVLAHNSNYVWEGVVGNTSDNTEGISVHSCYRFTTAMAFTGTGPGNTKGFYAVGYSENSAPFYSFSGATPQQVAQRIQGCAGGGNGYDWDFADSDGSVVYFACISTQNQVTLSGSGNPGAICAFNADGSIMRFSTGTTIKQKHKPFVNGIFVGTQPSITGLAVQKGNNLLAASVAADNMVYLRDKVTGAPVGSFAVTAAGPLAFAPNGDLWVSSGTGTVYKYTNVNASPNSPTLAVTIPGFTRLDALAVSPSTAPQPNLLLVADGGSSQQIKAFDSSGTAQWTLGSAGGYSTDATVTNTKFWFRDPRGSIAFQPDGSFWIVDYGNYRNLKFALSATQGALPTYQTQIAYVPSFYNATVDQNNPNRVFVATLGKWLEFAVDYTLPLGGTNGSWTLVKNWGYAVPDLYKNFGLEGFRGVATLGNGRTYGIAKARGNQGSSIFELPSSGNLRLTTEVPFTPSVLLYADGSLRTRQLHKGVITFIKQALTGFAPNGDPQWGAETTLASAPGVVGVNPSSGAARVHITGGNRLVFFDDSGKSGKHLGGIDLGGSTASWMWETAPGLPQGLYLSGDGAYETASGVKYFGGVADVRGSNIIYLYKGENWQGGEASQLMHYHEDGLFVGQFGTSGRGPSQDSPPGFAGNTVSGAMTVSGGNTYIYVNDESQHGGMHRWRLEGTGTIAELSGSGALDSTIILAGTAPSGTAPARTGVPAAPAYFNATPTNGKINLHWQPAADATYYQIRRASSLNGGYQIIATSVFVPTYYDFDVSPGRIYYYRVMAINSFGASNPAAVTAAITSNVSNIYEAELGVLSGPVVSPDPKSASNGARINNGNGTVTINNINGNAGGTVPLTIRYAHNMPGNWTGASLKINGVNVALPPLPDTGGWSAYADVTFNVTLNPGTANSLIFSRPPNTDKFTFGVSTPFAGTPWAVPAASGTLKIEAEHYNYGGQGAGFKDTAVPATGSVYRPCDGVGIMAVPAASNGHLIGNTAAGEWLEYTVSVPTTKAYTFTLYAGSSLSGKTLRVENEAGKNLSGNMPITNTGGVNTLVAHTATLNLVAGTHRLRIFLTGGGCSLDYFTISH